MRTVEGEGENATAGYSALNDTKSMSLNESLKHANLTQEEIAFAEKLVIHALNWRGLGYFDYEARSALAILAANYRLQQRVRGKKSKGAAKERAGYRRDRVDLFLRYVVDKKYRDNPTSLATVMEIIYWLDIHHIEASESQVRRDIHAALTRGALPTD
jgi:hypothetical protein